jgi:hypothetical protein
MHWTLDDLYDLPVDVYDVLIEELQRDREPAEGDSE